MSFGNPGLTPKKITASNNDNVGKRVFAYSLITNGSADATITFKKTDNSGTVIWKDTITGSDNGRPFVFPDHCPLGTAVNDDIHCEVTGTGSEAYIMYA